MMLFEHGGFAFVLGRQSRTRSKALAEELGLPCPVQLESSPPHIPLALTGVTHLLYFFPHVLQVATL